MFLGNYQEAIVDFSKALEIDSKDSYLYFWRGRAYESLMDYPNAVKDLKISQQLDPNFGLTKIVLDHIKNKGYQ
jgi:tetratricopeptide (TPR) repeat protein